MTPDAPRALRVFVNATAVDVPVGSSALDAVRQWNADEADRVGRGERILTDSRGLPIATEVTVSAGAIFRILPARQGRGTIEAGAGHEEA